VCSLVGLAIFQNTSMGLEGITFLPSPWINEIFNLFLFQFHFSDFMLECKITFPMVVIKDHLPFCNLWKVLLSNILHVLFIGLQNPWSYKILPPTNNKLHLVECNTMHTFTLLAQQNCHHLFMNKGSLFCFLGTKSTKPGCFKSCSWCLWKALNKEGCMGFVPWCLDLWCKSSWILNDFFTEN
jgi:hypothetical protein